MSEQFKHSQTPIEVIKKMSEKAEPTLEQVDETLGDYLKIKKSRNENKVETVDNEYSKDITAEDFKIIKRLRNKVKENPKQGPGFRAWTPAEINFIELFEMSPGNKIHLDNLQQRNELEKMGRILRKETEYKIINVGDNSYQLVKVKK
ncbi:MAG: hypothetical protein WCF92_00230 [bacterium]